MLNFMVLRVQKQFICFKIMFRLAKIIIDHQRFRIIMQFPFKIPLIFEVDKQSNIMVLNGISLGKTVKQIKPQHIKIISEVISKMGSASASAQKLKQVITTFEKFIGSDNRIYLKVEGDRVLGMLRVGEKNLFYRDYIGNIKEMRPTCVLDFYVHESCQRGGIGKEMFVHFLKVQNKSAEKLAYDRPSEKLIGFLRKHFGLAKYIPQNNNYVIFNAYFDPNFKELVPSLKDLKQLPKKENKPKQYCKQIKQSKELKEINQLISSTEALVITSLKRDSFPNTQPTQQLKTNKNILLNTLSKKGYEVVSPWAIVGSQSTNSNFRTTSNSYGDHYSYRKR